MHAPSCSSSLEENTVNSRILTRTREHLVRFTIHDRSTGCCRACLDSDRCGEPPERFEPCICDFGRGGYRSDEEAYSECPSRQ